MITALALDYYIMGLHYYVFGTWNTYLSLVYYVLGFHYYVFGTVIRSSFRSGLPLLRLWHPYIRSYVLSSNLSRRWFLLVLAWRFHCPATDSFSIHRLVLFNPSAAFIPQASHPTPHPKKSSHCTFWAFVIMVVVRVLFISPSHLVKYKKSVFLES